MSITQLNIDLTQQLAPTQVAEALALLEPAQRIALLAHEHPDGDCLGSALGLAHILTELGKICVPVCIDTPSHTWDFLPGIATFQNDLGDENFDLVIALDAGELSRYGALAERHRAFLERVPILNIDHHISSSGCGQVNIIEPSTAATAELLVLFQQQAHLPVNKEAALCLLTGLITDTGSFQYSSTTARTLQVGATLLQAGAVPETIVKPVFRTHSFAEMRFQSAVIANAHTACNGRLIWSYATEETLAASQAEAHMDDNFSSILRDIEGVQIAAFFKNYNNGNETRVSLRSAAPYNVAAFCMRFGGGGHPRAAGVTIKLPLSEAIELVIKELKKELNEAK